MALKAQDRQVRFVLALRDAFQKWASAPVTPGPNSFTDYLTQSVLTLTLTDQLGNGLGGSVHRIDPRSEGLKTLGLQGRSVVIKMPHTVPGFAGKLPYPHCNYGQDQEAKMLERVLLQVEAVEKDPRFPRDPSWARGTLPVAPVLKVLQTDRGIVLLKLELQGITIGELRKRHGMDLPPEIMKGLRDIYDLAQAVLSRTEVPGLHPLIPVDPFGVFRKKAFTRPFLIDINPTNLVWIQDEALMALLHLHRPGFAFYELAEHPSPRYDEKNMSFEDFLGEFDVASAYEAGKLDPGALKT